MRVPKPAHPHIDRMAEPMDVVARCRSIELLLSDVDGVLTDGGVIFDNEGIEIKRFHIRDGLGIKLWQRAGHQFGIVTGRASHIVQLRAVELGVELVRQGVDDKLPAIKQIMSERGLKPEQICYVGDDLPDLPVLRYVGFAAAVHDGCDELQRAAHYVTRACGGKGALREVIEVVLKAQGRWDDVLQKYGA